jgi:hypothetical protein
LACCQNPDVNVDSLALASWMPASVFTGLALRVHDSENTPTLELLKLIHYILQTRNLVDRPSPYPRRFGNVSDIAGMNVTSIKAINMAR